MSGINSNLRKVQLIQWSLIVSILVFAGIAELVCAPGSERWSLKRWLVVAAGLWAAWTGAKIRSLFLRKAGKMLAKNALDPKGLKRWEAANLISLAMATTVALWGLVLRFVLSAVFWQASLFYGAGIVLLLLWTPRAPAEILSK